MNPIREQAKQKRRFLPAGLCLDHWKAVQPFAGQLLELPIACESDLKSWLRMRSELESALEEEKAWLYIHQSCKTDNEENSRAFSDFVQRVYEPYALIRHQLDEKLLAYCELNGYPQEYEIFIRTIRQQAALFREENTKIQAQLEVEEQEYGTVTGSMTITYQNQELTLQQAQNLLKSPQRATRQEAFEHIGARRNQDALTLHGLLDRLLEKRHQLALNAGFENFLTYRFAQLGRFDYTVADCHTFHKAAQDYVVPLLDYFHTLRKEKLQLDTLRPYDLDVDENGLEPLKPFASIDELVNHTIACFADIDPDFGTFIQIMRDNGFLDLESRKGKAPGGYNYPLPESNVPFIFMNATRNLRDLETMMHEGGHAIHSFLCKDLEFSYFKETPAEIAEVASMAMELISMEHWEHFFTHPADLKRAKLSQLHGIIEVIPWVATIDKFQHWLYTHPQHNHEQRTQAWLQLQAELGSSCVNWDGYATLRENLWQKQIHIYQFPLYYIEYGIAQLGALGIWRNYKNNPKQAVQQYRKALSMGYSKTLPELYREAGIAFNFSANYIRELMAFVKHEIDALNTNG